jgi:hypothetical protein
MATNRVLYQSEALFCNAIDDHDGLVSGDQLLRVQDISHGVELNRTDVNEFGQLAAIERKIIEPPTVSLDFSYYLHGGRNEGLMGFQFTPDAQLDVADADGLVNAASGFLSSDVGKNYYITVSDEGEDAKAVGSTDPASTSGGATDAKGMIGIGNGYITSYNVEAAVGDIPSSSISVEANNILFKTGQSGHENPAINLNTGDRLDTNTVEAPKATATGEEGDNYQHSCLRPGDITVNFNDAGNGQAKDHASKTAQLEQLGGAKLEGDGQAHLQNFTIDVPMARTALNRIGNVFPYAREIDLPLAITFSCSAFMADFSDGELKDILCGDSDKRNIRVTMNAPCSDAGGTRTGQAQTWLLKGMELDSQNFSASIGDNKTVDLVFSAQLAGVGDKNNGLFMWDDGADADITPADSTVSVNPGGTLS